MAALRSQIGQTQREVMAGLPAGYQARHTYSAVPALAGRVTPKAALAPLARHPHVVRIERCPRVGQPLEPFVDRLQIARDRFEQ